MDVFPIEIIGAIFLMLKSVNVYDFDIDNIILNTATEEKFYQACNLKLQLFLRFPSKQLS